MTATHTTTEIGPDQARLRRLLRRLAEVTSVDVPVLSVYADVRPHAHAERPGERSELRIVRSRLNELEGSLEPHSDAHVSFAADRERIETWLDAEDLAGTDGVAIFACDRIGLWEVVRTNEAFGTRVSAGPTADLFGLARLLDASNSAVVALVDTNTCRLFVTRRGDLVERSGPDEGNVEHRRRDRGGWSQARYQRHIDTQDRRFAKEAAEAIDRLVERERATRVLIAGNERATSVLDDELPERVRSLVEHVARIDMRATRDEVHEEVAPILSAIEEADGTDVAERAIAGWRADDLGVTGLDATMAALEAGQVHELVIDETAYIDDDLRGELIRQASLTDARVEIVHGHEALLRREGVGATLRYRA